MLRPEPRPPCPMAGFKALARRDVKRRKSIRRSPEEPDVGLKRLTISLRKAEMKVLVNASLMRVKTRSRIPSSLVIYSRWSSSKPGLWQRMPVRHEKRGQYHRVRVLLLSSCSSCLLTSAEKRWRYYDGKVEGHTRRKKQRKNSTNCGTA